MSRQTTIIMSSIYKQAWGCHGFIKIDLLGKRRMFILLSHMPIPKIFWWVLTAETLGNSMFY